MIFFLRSIFVQTLLNAFILFRIWKSKDIPQVLKYLLTLIYGLETSMYFVGLFCSERIPVDTFALIQKISGVWVIFQVYIGALILFFDLILYLNKKRQFLVRFADRTIKRVKIISFIAGVIFICIQLYIGYENFLHPNIKTITYSFNKPEDKSAKPRETYKLLLAADIHLGYIIDNKMLDRYVQIINNQHADIVVIDGDLVDYTLRPLVHGKMDEKLKEIKAPKGVFFVPGNHEYKFNAELKLDWIAGSGMTILKDSVANIDNNLLLIGRDDRSNDDRKPIEDLMATVDSTQARIFIAHQPGDIKDAYRYNIPLTLCGHTHDGQIFPMNLLGWLLYTNNYGIQTKGASTSYTTSGLGLSGFPLRILTHSEIVIFIIEIY